MSLFGSSPDASAPAPLNSKSRSSLFDDEPSPALGAKNSLFADDEDTPGASPWGIPTPKKAGRAELLKTLLPASDVPEVYIDIFDNLVKGEDGIGGEINTGGLTKVLSAGRLDAEAQSRIMGIITSGKPLQNLGRNEFNVFLALIALAQEHEDITLDTVDERRKKLPEPKLPGIATISIEVTPSRDSTANPSQPIVTAPSDPVSVSSPRARNSRKDSLEFPEADPWGSPALHKGHNHGNSKANGTSSSVPVTESRLPVRTTSDFTTTSAEGSNGSPSQRPEEAMNVPAGGVWGSYDGTSSESYSNPGAVSVGGEGFGGPELNPPTPNPITRSFGGGRVTSAGVEENIVISLLPEKEGIFMFQHHNYQVSSSRRGSKVVRRYSDFVWLLDCLQKRYPFRQIPLLPPKRVGVNGSHLAADGSFIEKRRRGLARFANALVRHPILNQEQLVIMFLTVPTHQELAVWRKQATISVQEEFVGRALPPGLEDSLSPTLNDLFETSRSGIRRSAEVYINLCILLDRLTKRNEGLAADHLRISISLQALTDASQDTYASDTNDVPLLNEGLNATAKHLSNSQSLLEDEARAWDQGVLEDLKRQRDTLVSMRDLFDRRDRYDKDNIPYLERRIQSNESKLVAIRAKPEGTVKPGEVEKVTEAIIKDKESIVAQHARGVFIKECVRDELVYFQQSQYHVSRLHQDWAQERVKYSEMQADNWKQLHEELESMPIGE